MKKIILATLCTLFISNSFATPATSASTQKLIESYDLQNYVIDIFSDEAIYDPFADHIIALYQPDLSDNQHVRQQIKQVIKSYYISPEFIQKYTQDVYTVYQDNFTEEETQAWTKFNQSTIGKSILNNKKYTQDLSKALANLFNQNHELSEKNQQKVAELMQQLVQDD